MNDLAKGLLAPIVVFLILLLLGWVIIDQMTASPEILNQSLTSVPTGTDPFGDAATPSNSGQQDLYLEDIADGLFSWIVTVSAVGVLSALTWFALSQVAQRTVVGPRGQTNAFKYWVLIAILYCATLAAAFFFIFKRFNIDTLMDQSFLYAYLGASVVLGFVAYWLATAIAASPVMKPSVPAAARKRRS